MRPKVSFWSWWPSNGNAILLAFAIFGTIFTLFFAGWDFFDPDYIDIDNPQWVRYAVLFAPTVIFIIKQIHTYYHWKEMKRMGLTK